MVDLVWYTSYGSNMHADRLGCYIAGGRPEGASRTCSGCRDTSMPRDSRGTLLPGGIHFATHSPVWNGGRALYDPELPGSAAARSWLVTPGQFADIVAQEMYREPGEDLDLDEVLARGRVALGPGRYETLLHTGEVDGRPQLTFTAAQRCGELRAEAPSGPYLRMLAGGLRSAHGWSVGRVVDYFLRLPGIGAWTREELTGML